MPRNSFEETFSPYLSSAYNFARWLIRNEQDAQDITQEAYLRALRSFGDFKHGRDPLAWLLTIVRNTAYGWMRRNRMDLSLDMAVDPISPESDPEAMLVEMAGAAEVRSALAELPLDYREILVLREMEDMPYKEIAALLEIPLGTVMSRLSRARQDLARRLQTKKGGKSA